MDKEQITKIQKNIETIEKRIAKAASSAGRGREQIELIAVTKQKSAAVIKTLADLGITHIGESYLKESLFKMDLLKDFNIRWHMIGGIQKGKEKNIAARFSEVHSIASLRTANALNKFSGIEEKILPSYLEFNISGEESKHGWTAWNEKNWPELIPEIEEICQLENIKIKGLMTMAPYSLDAENSRPYFKKLGKLREYLTSKIPGFNGEGLSMGMSGDYQVAIEEGATVIRIGSALVGPR